MYETESRTTFLGSSAVERSAVNRLVVGSNPTRGDLFESTSIIPSNWIVVFPTYTKSDCIGP